MLRQGMRNFSIAKIFTKMHNKFILNLSWLFVLNRNFGLCALVTLFFDCIAFATEHKISKLRGKLRNLQVKEKPKTSSILNLK